MWLMLALSQDYLNKTFQTVQSDNICELYTFMPVPVTFFQFQGHTSARKMKLKVIFWGQSLKFV